MDTTNTTVKTAKLNPDFSHRMTAMGNEATPARLCDAVTSSADRVIGVLHMLSSQYIDGTDKWNDEITNNVIEAIIGEVNDIKAFVRAYYNAMKTAGQS